MNLPTLTEEHIWVAIGLVGQGMFFMRFFVQWMASEKQKKSIIPYSFWYFSIAGSVIVLAYGLWRMDPVIIIGQMTGSIIYFRNLFLIHRKPKAPTSETIV